MLSIKYNKKVYGLSIAAAVVFIAAALLLTTVFAVSSFGSDINDNNAISLKTQIQKKHELPTASLNNTIVVGGNAQDKTINLNFDVFKDEYTNQEGQIIVKSDNGEAIVAPGTEAAEDGATFNIYNAGDTTTQFECDFYCNFNDDVIPLNFKLIDPYGKYLLGSKEEYSPAININDVNDVASINPGETLVYKMPWYWAFEENEDARDTTLGTKATWSPIKVTVGINNEEPQPQPDDPTIIDPAQTGDSIAYTFICLILFTFISSAVLLIKFRKKA